MLSEHWLLTAGHCLHEVSEDRLEVRHELFGERTVVYQGRADLIRHPKYEDIGHPAHRWYDIGLVGIRDGALDATERGRIYGLTRTFEILFERDRTLYSVGNGRLPEPETGLCGEELGSKKPYDGLDLRKFTSPPLANAMAVELDGRPHALCDGDSGAPLLLDLDGAAHAFAVFSGETADRTVFHGTLVGPKINWLESATAQTEAPLDCVERTDDGWECFE